MRYVFKPFSKTHFKKLSITSLVVNVIEKF